MLIFNIHKIEKGGNKMKGKITEKILKQHIITGISKTGEGLAHEIDRTLTQNATGSMAYIY